MKTPISLSAILAMSLVVGCGGGPQNGGGGGGEEDGWWNNPGLVRDRLAQVGVANFMGNKALALRNAEADGVAKIAAALKTRITQLTENWAKEVGDLAAGPDSFTSLVNNETLTTQFTNTTLAGATPHKYKMIGDTQYCLVTLADPVKWTNNVIDELEKSALADETLWKTEVMKRDFASKMDKLRKEETGKVESEQKAIEEAIGN